MMYTEARLGSLQSYQRWNMAILTVEGVVENGRIRSGQCGATRAHQSLRGHSDVEAHSGARLQSTPSASGTPDFAKQVIEVSTNAEL